MRLPSFLQRKNKTEPDAAVPVAGQGEAVLAARTRARRRLIGAVVLLGVGIVGFPLLFETQPRPVPVDIPIEVARKDAPAPPPASNPRPLPPAAVLKPEPPAPEPLVITERSGDAGTEVPPRAAAASAAAPAAASVPRAERAASSAPRVVASAPAAKPASAAAAASRPAAHDDGARAQALLDGSAPASSAAAARFVVQAGAYTDATALREARQKVEKLGLKTYTQVIETEGGKRTRVRIGPFATRQEAEAAAAKIKAAGLPAALLAL